MRCRSLAFAAVVAWTAPAAGGTPSRPPAPPMAPGAGRAAASKKPAARGPVPKVVMETPHRVGATSVSQKGDAPALSGNELRHWNAGGIGGRVSAVPAAKGHPAPRVIVNVVSITGAHDGREVQRVARRNHWIQVIQCYRLGAYRDPLLHGWTQATLSIGASGDVSAAELLDTELADRSVAQCMVERLRNLKFPEASEGSSAVLHMRVGPGDEPVLPPEDRLGPGDGALPTEAMRAGMRSGLSRFDACYRTALAATPELWGRMQLMVRVNEQGFADEVFEVGTQFPAPRMRQCVVAEVKRLRFAKPEGGSARFVIGLRFSSNRSRLGAAQGQGSTRSPTPRRAKASAPKSTKRK